MIAVSTTWNYHRHGAIAPAVREIADLGFTAVEIRAKGAVPDHQRATMPTIQARFSLSSWSPFCGPISTPTSSYAEEGESKAKKKPDFPKFEKVAGDLDKVISTADGSAPLYELYKDDKTGELLGVLPRNFEKQLLMIACTVSGGDSQAGVMGPTHYAKWRRFDKQLALIAPNFLEANHQFLKLQLKKNSQNCNTLKLVSRKPWITISTLHKPLALFLRRLKPSTESNKPFLRNLPLMTLNCSKTLLNQ